MSSEYPDIEPAFNVTHFEFKKNPYWIQFREAFSNLPVDDHGDRWAHLWEKSFRPWDKGFSSPSLVELLESQEIQGAIARGEHFPHTVIKRALVPGCGAGYDVTLLGAGYGYQAVGLDISPGAIKAAKELYEQDNLEDDINWGGGDIKYVEGDFFTDDWFQEAGVGFRTTGQFELIYDYTFLCALPPVLRQKWAKRMAELVHPERGHLICLEFPLGKDESLGGPPWGLESEIYDQILGDAGMELVIRYKPKNTHIIGEGRDLISIWKKSTVQGDGQTYYTDDW